MYNAKLVMSNEKIPHSSFLISHFSFLISIFLLIAPLFAQDMSKKLTSKELIQMSTDDSFKLIQKLNKEESSTLITQIRSEAKSTNPDVDKLYLLLSHLESIKAIEEEQSRLNSMQFVYGLALLSFILVVGIVFFKQRASIESINRLLKD